MSAGQKKLLGEGGLLPESAPDRGVSELDRGVPSPGFVVGGGRENRGDGVDGTGRVFALGEPSTGGGPGGGGGSGGGGVVVPGAPTEARGRGAPTVEALCA